MEVIRYISIFDKQTDKLLQEVKVSFISLNDLVEIVGFHDEDPHLYKVYFLDEKQFEKINEFLKEPIRKDFSNTVYTLDCFTK